MCVWLLWMWPALVYAADAQTNAWALLNRGLAEGNPLKRAQAITALASAGGSPRVVDRVEAALKDKEDAVRQTAAAVLGEMRARRSIPKLEDLLNDESPEVSFSAAKALWEIGNQNGRDILRAVLAGERKTSPGMIKGGMEDARNRLHNPRALALMGIKEGAGALLGPFSLGIGLAEELMKDKSAPARALSAKLMGSDPDPRTTADLEHALDDKNGGVRAAVARALGQRGGRDSIAMLQPLMADSNDGVRYMAAAAIIRLSRPKPAATAK
jgi:HEAT repeat protein